ncbi:MAG: hypothetical protein ACLQU3_03250 [Limisphaerales bacterium]
MVINELRLNMNHVFLAQVLTRHGYDMRELDDTFEASTWYRDHWTKDRIITRVR